jgi:hypothetical protein
LGPHRRHPPRPAVGRSQLRPAGERRTRQPRSPAPGRRPRPATRPEPAGPVRARPAHAGPAHAEPAHVRTDRRTCPGADPRARIPGTGRRPGSTRPDSAAAHWIPVRRPVGLAAAADRLDPADRLAPPPELAPGPRRLAVVGSVLGLGVPQSWPRRLAVGPQWEQASQKSWPRRLAAGPVMGASASQNSRPRRLAAGPASASQS